MHSDGVGTDPGVGGPRIMYDGPADNTRGIRHRHKRWPKYTVESLDAEGNWRHLYGPYFDYDRNKACQEADWYTRRVSRARVIEWASHTEKSVWWSGGAGYCKP